LSTIYFKNLHQARGRLFGRPVEGGLILQIVGFAAVPDVVLFLLIILFYPSPPAAAGGADAQRIGRQECVSLPGQVRWVLLPRPGAGACDTPYRAGIGTTFP
jgi:hypothetical protein